MQQLLLIALGGSLGAVARYSLSTVVHHAASETFPWGTLAVNLSGSFLIGLVIELLDVTMIPTEWRSFLAIGFLGAYTTFSTFTLETVNLLREGEFGLATVNLLAANVAGILLVVGGIYASRLLLKLVS